MASTLISLGNVYEGFWTDWTKGGISGYTLTLHPKFATFLTNALAIFVTLCSVQLWTIIRYALHYKITSLQPNVSTPHLDQICKQRFVLRNASSALATAQLMLEVGWSSRKATGKHSLRAYVIAIWAASYALLFMIAGVLSNNAISAASQRGISPVLLRSESCGTWNETYYDIMNARPTVANFDISVEYSSKIAQDAQLSMEYAQQCYLSPSTMTNTSSTCRTLKSPAISWNTSTTKACPFDHDLCHNNAGIVRLDTGRIDSHTHLGINAKHEDRLTYQRVTTCTVLNDTSHITGWNGTMRTSSNAKPSPSVAYAFYGPNSIYSTEHTYSYSNFADFYTNYTGVVTNPYQLNIDTAFAKSGLGYNSSSDFVPDRGLAQLDADLYLIFLSYTGVYLEPVDDPWFSAHQAHENPVAHRDFFGRDQAISTMGCTDQHEFCTSDNICTGLLGMDQILNVASFNNILTAHQNATFDRLTRAATYSTFQVIPWLSQTQPRSKLV